MKVIILIMSIILLLLKSLCTSCTSDHKILDRIIYIETPVLTEDEWKTITLACEGVSLTNETSSFTNRNKAVLDSNSVYDIFYGRIMNLISKKVGLKLIPSSIPIEYRTYEKGGNMGWHRDTILTSRHTPQIEVVFTVHNTSDSYTEWVPDETYETHRIHSKPNTIMITQGGSVLHRVTDVTRGSRSIIKIAYDVL